MNDDKLSEKEIDDRVIAAADDENAWEDVINVGGARVRREKFLEALSKLPEVEPVKEDRLD